MASPDDIQDWINKVKRAESAQDVLHILDQFRPLAWTNQERSAMAHAYLRVLEKMPKVEEAIAPNAKQSEASDGPVWYEKM